MYLNQPLKKYLDEAAAKLPAPGGGSVSAFCGSLGAAMASMAANFTLGKEKYKEVENEIRPLLSQSEELRKRLAELTDADVEAYGKIATAYRMPKAGAEEKAKRSRAIREACKEALKVPLKTAECCREILNLSRRLVDIANVNLISDVGVAVILAEAALQAAALNVEINLVSLKDKRFVKEKRECLESLLRESPVIKDEVLEKVNQSILGSPSQQTKSFSYGLWSMDCGPRLKGAKMTAKLLDGGVLAGNIKEGLKKEIEELKGKGITPSLVAVQVGENPASRIYIRNQKKSCEEIGIDYQLHELSAETTEEELLRFIGKLNGDARVTGIILQMPLPSQINSRRIQATISPSKDVEGMNPANLGMLLYGQAKVAPCTALGAMELLKSSGVDLKGQEVTVVGHSEIVGKPIILMLLQSLDASPTPTVCHIATRDLAAHTRKADILIVAVGKAGLIKGDMIKEGAIVIDIGINRVPLLDDKGNPVLNDKGKPKKKMVGDVVFEEAVEKASYISPVPGGVGPLTTAMLLKNTVECAKG